MHKKMKIITKSILIMFLLGIGIFKVCMPADATDDQQWYQEYTYTLETADSTSGEQFILLHEYQKAAESVYVPATAVIDGVTYRTKLASRESGIWHGARDSIKNITFEKGCKVSDGGFLFHDLPKLEAVNTEALDMSQATSTAWMFSGCHNLTKLDVADWDVSNVTNMFNMFGGCEKLKELDVSRWNTSKVTVMVSVFDHCKRLSVIDVEDWDVSKVTMMSSMFYFCEKLDTLDLHKWDTSQVTQMWEMFGRCYSLRSLNVKGWDTDNVTTMAGMFCCNYNLEAIDLSSFDMTKVIFKQYDDQMFLRCASLKKIYTPKKTTQKLYFNSGLSYVKKKGNRLEKRQYEYIPETDESILMVCKQTKSKKTKITDIKVAGKKLRVKWKKVTAGFLVPVQYEVQCSTNKNFTDSVGKMSGITDATYSVEDNVTDKTGTTIKGLTKGKKYYIRVRVYTYEKRLSDWSKIKKVKVK